MSILVLFPRWLDTGACYCWFDTSYIIDLVYIYNSLFFFFAYGGTGSFWVILIGGQ